MRIALVSTAFAFLILSLAGCNTELITPFDDAPSSVVVYLPDAGSGLVHPDAPAAQDAGVALDDAPALHDASSPSPDVSTRVDTDAGAGLPDAYVVASPDAFVVPDSPRDRCASDSFEANETMAAAQPIPSGVGWAPTDYPMTWHEGDSADWVSRVLDTTGVVGLFRVHASDVGSNGGAVEVRVTCRDGLVTCRGVGTSRVGPTCIGRRVGNAYADVGCVGSTPAAVSVVIGVERGAGECEHTLSVSLQPASF